MKHDLRKDLYKDRMDHVMGVHTDGKFRTIVRNIVEKIKVKLVR